MADAPHCAHLLADLSDYLDGAAAAEVCAEIERHLAECEECRVVVDTLGKTVTLYHTLPQPALPSATRTRLFAALKLERYIQDRDRSKGDRMMQEHYGFGCRVAAPMNETIERTTAALKEQGFGVLTTIDVQQTLKNKIGVDFQPYVILGACNPHLAHRALQTEKELGLLLPCNVIVYDNGDASCTVSIVDPAQMMGVVENPELAVVAADAKARLARVVEHLTA